MPELLRSERMPNDVHVFPPFDASAYSGALGVLAELDEVAHHELIDDSLRQKVPEAPLFGQPGTSRLKVAALVHDIERVAKNVTTLLPSVGDNDEDLERSFRTKPFNRHLRYLCARYIHEIALAEVGIHPDRLINFADDVLDSAPRIADQLTANDIPAYTALFNEFDRLRHEEGGIVEAYMGRDGIFAYFARLGQLAARGDNEPGHMGTNTDLEVPPADPRYVVFSSFIRDGSHHTRLALTREFLERVIDPGDNVHFYDTGFKGTVPKRIMEILGISRAEFGHRTHLLLSRDSFDKQIVGLRGYPRRKMVANIESYSQAEGPAEKIVRDKSDGKVKYKAPDSYPSERFEFLVRRHLLYRHFLQTEYKRIRNTTLWHKNANHVDVDLATV